MRILFVEDSEEASRSVLRTLRREGHDVVLAANAADARDRLAEATFDLVLADYGLGDGETGLDVLRFVRDRFPDTARVLTSGGVRIDDFTDVGWYSFIGKPFSRLELLAIVDKAQRKEE